MSYVLQFLILTVPALILLACLVAVMSRMDE